MKNFKRVFLGLTIFGLGLFLLISIGVKEIENSFTRMLVILRHLFIDKV